MAVGASMEVNTGNNADATSYTMGTSGGTGSYTPPATATHFLCHVDLSSTNAVPTPGLSWLGLTWTLLGSGNNYRTTNPRHGQFVFWAYGIGSAGTGTLTTNDANTTGAFWQLVKATGVETAGGGALAFRRNATAANNAVAAAGTVPATLPAAANSDSRAIGFLASNSLTGWTWARSNWATLGTEQSHTTPNADVVCGFNSTAFDATVEATNGTGGSVSGGVYAVELMAPNPGNNFLALA